MSHQTIQPEGWAPAKGYANGILTEDGTLYFFSRREGGFGHGDIYRSRLVAGHYAEVENLGEPVNGASHEVDPFIVHESPPTKRPPSTFHNSFKSFNPMDVGTIVLVWNIQILSMESRV